MNYARQASNNLFIEDGLRDNWRDYLGIASSIKSELEHHSRAIRGQEIFSESEGMSGSSTSRGEEGQEVAATLTGSTPSSRGGGSSPIAGSFVVAAFDPRNVTSKINRTRVKDGLPANTLHQGGMSVIIYSDVSPTLPGSGSGTARPGGQGAEPEFYVVAKPLLGKAGSRANAGNVSNKTSALQASQIPAVLRPDQNFAVRRLTPLECERLQGFPDNWTNVNGQKDSPRYGQMGNAVTRTVAAWIGKRIVAVEREQK